MQAGHTPILNSNDIYTQRPCRSKHRNCPDGTLLKIRHINPLITVYMISTHTSHTIYTGAMLRKLTAQMLQWWIYMYTHMWIDSLLQLTAFTVWPTVSIWALAVFPEVTLKVPLASAIIQTGAATYKEMDGCFKQPTHDSCVSASCISSSL